jgi:integrase
MALIKRGNIYHVRTQVAGVKIAKSTKTSNKRVAEQLEAQWISEVHSEVVIAKRRPITFEKAIVAYKESRRGTTAHRNIGNKFAIFSELSKLNLHELKTADIQNIALDAVNDHGYAISTVNTALLYWNALQNFCIKNGFTPGPKVKPLKGQTGRIRFLSDDEVTKLLNELNPSNPIYTRKRFAQDTYDFVVALLHTGARDREMADLTLSQIDIPNNTITINRSKGGTDTTLTMSNTLRAMVLRRIATAALPMIGKTLHGRTGNGFLFPERAAATKHSNMILIDACERLSLEDVTLHTLRHTFACKMLRAGMSIVDCQHLLGHRNLASTMCYMHLVPNLTADRAAQVLNA